jgi:lipoteichoic acid synthase
LISDPAIETDGDSLLAGWLGLGLVMLVARLNILLWSEGRIVLLPIAAYQDVGLLAVLAWTFWWLQGLTRRPGARLMIVSTGWILCLAIAIYSTFSGMVYRTIGDFPTYRLLFMSNQFKGAETSIREGATNDRIVRLIAAPLFVILAAYTTSRLAPSALNKTANWVFSFRGVVCVGFYFAFAQLVMPKAITYPAATVNPEVRFVSSFFEPSEPKALGEFPEVYTSDFLPVRGRPSGSPTSSMFADILQRVDRSHPPNIMLVVMESVGTHELQLYGASYHDTPELVHLSQHGVLFNRIYAPEPLTSSAMAALFCSLYPPHFWQTLSEAEPDVRVDGLPALLAAHGYRTLFLHSSVLVYDREHTFLSEHGFPQIMTDASETPRDDRLVPKALKWINQDRSRPFFLVVWTNCTHHPYLSDRSENYGVRDVYLNRYLNAIRSTDAMIGDLVGQLDAIGLADNTLTVITGDHGEAFHEHGSSIHGLTVYDEEVHVPLLLVNRRLFPQPLKIEEIGQQIDLAPTLLELLGLESPPHWQGRSLFASERTNRAYLFASPIFFMFGLVDRDLKYIYDPHGYRTALYDLSRDPAEHTNLINDRQYVTKIRQARAHIAAWINFQNQYLAGIRSESASSAVGKGKSISSPLR